MNKLSARQNNSLHFTPSSSGSVPLAISLLLASAQVTWAAAPKEAVAALPGSTWTGLYAGVSAGVIFNDSDLKSSHINLVEDPCQRNIHSTSFLPGVHVGYLRQMSEGWVLGGEADFTYPDSSGSGNCLCFNSSFDKFTVKNRIQGSLRGRVGYALDHNLLPYLAAGVSFADTSLRYTNENGDAYSQNTAQTGWVLGGGLEYGFHEHFSVRTEYLYSDYGNALSTSIPTIGGVTDSAGRAAADLASHTVRAALSYHF